MRKKIITLFFILLAAACGGNNAALPTLIPTIQVEEMPATPSAPLPATNTPLSSEPDTVITPDVVTDEAEAIIREIDLQTCQEAVAAQAELDTLQEQGQNVTELATAVAELIDELENCEILLTPTPFN